MNARPSLLLICEGLLLVGVLACGGEEGDETPSASPSPTPAEVTPTATPTPVPGVNFEGEMPYSLLSEYHFYQGDMAELSPVPGVLPYAVVSPLWSDAASKSRFIVLPPEGKVNFDVEGDWNWPVGTILIKNFYYPVDQRQPDGARRLMETRLLIHEEVEWTAHTYIWNDQQTDAVKTVAGKLTSVEFVNMAGDPVTQTYLVPNTNQCGDCHVHSDAFTPLGPRTRQLNYVVDSGGGTQVNQIQWLADQGVFDESLPDATGWPALTDPLGLGELDWRARSYLDANCSHCHRQGGGAENSGLWLEASVTDPQTYGICKEPVAAGSGSGPYHYDIVPGSPDESILVYRMESLEPDIRMPEFGTAVVDVAGVQVIRDWIASMDPVVCGEVTPTP